MNFFRIKTSWSNTEFIVLKLCIASAYIFIGSYFHDFFSHYWKPILITFAVTVLWTFYLWTKKIKAEKWKNNLHNKKLRKYFLH